MFMRFDEDEAKVPIHPGDFVFVKPDISARRFDVCVGIAIADHTVFLGDSVICYAELHKPKILTLAEKHLKKYLQEQYVAFFNRCMKFDVKKMVVGDLFVMNNTEYLYLGEYENLDIYICFPMDIANDQSESTYEKIHKQLISGKMSEKQLTNWIKSEESAFTSICGIPDMYYVGHADIKVSKEADDYLKSPEYRMIGYRHRE